MWTVPSNIFKHLLSGSEVSMQRGTDKVNVGFQTSYAFQNIFSENQFAHLLWRYSNCWNWYSPAFRHILQWHNKFCDTCWSSHTMWSWMTFWSSNCKASKNGVGLDNQVSTPNMGSKGVFPPQPCWLWDPPNLLSNGYWGRFPSG